MTVAAAGVGGVGGVGPAEEDTAVPPPPAAEAEAEASRFDEKVGRNSTGGWRIAGERSRASPALISLPNLHNQFHFVNFHHSFDSVQLS